MRIASTLVQFDREPLRDFSVQTIMFLNRTPSWVRKTCSLSLRAAHAFAAILLVLIASTWIASFGGQAYVGLDVPMGMTKQWQFSTHDGILVAKHGVTIDCNFGELSTNEDEYAWLGLILRRDPTKHWELSVPMAWATLVLAPITCAPVLLRLRHRRRLESSSSGIMAMCGMTTHRGVCSSVASLARRWIAVTSIAVSIAIVGCLFQRAYGSATYRTNAGRHFAAHFYSNSLTLDWPWPCREQHIVNIPKYQAPGFEFVNYGRHQSLRLHPAFVLPLAALGMVPQIMHWYRRRRVAHRARNGLCLACGYDLTGNVTGACPECGRHSSIGGFVNPPV